MKMVLASLLLTGLMLAGNASAGGGDSNLLQNPHFDSDLAGWTSGSEAFTSWSGAEDHHEIGSSGTGSALITSSGAPEILIQCVNVDSNARYVLWASAKSICGHAAQLSLFFADDSCDVTNVGFSQATSSAGAWQPLSVSGLSPGGKFITAIAVLENSGDCHDNSYFDDVHLALDDVFNNGFEPKF